MAEPTHERDLTTEELLAMMNQWLEREPGIQLYVKWTCPQCGERCTSNEPNRFYAEGFKHEEKGSGEWCGFVYPGPFWGLMAVVGPRPSGAKKGEA